MRIPKSEAISLMCWNYRCKSSPMISKHGESSHTNAPLLVFISLHCLAQAFVKALINLSNKNCSQHDHYYPLCFEKLNPTKYGLKIKYLSDFCSLCSSLLLKQEIQ